MIFGQAFYWFFLSLIHLVRYTYKDITNNMTVDDRHNFFMMGATSGLIAIVHVNFFYLLSLIVGTSILGAFLKNKKALGDADIHSLMWLFSGFGLLGIQYYVLFITTFLGLTMLFFAAKYILAKTFKKDINRPVPFYPVILGAFLIVLSRIFYLNVG